MKRNLLLITYFICHFSFAQTPVVHRDAAISGMINEISSENLEKYVRELSAFRTRHTLSQNSEKEGILASQNYVLDLFKSFETSSNGRLSCLHRYLYNSVRWKKNTK
jgi:hypothetical protein